MGVPLVDLKAQLSQIEPEVRAGWDRVLARTAFILGDEVEAFEQAFAAFSGVAHCAGVGTGTDALELGLRALGVGPGDEVIVPANTFIASALAISRAGAKPVFVDCDPIYHLIDVDQVQAKIGPRTKAVMPVHLYGQCAPMQRVLDVAERAGIAVIEDAAQAQGARHGDTVAGGFGAVAATSFYPGKNLGAFGDGGAVLTRSEELIRKVKALRNYGSEVKYHHPEAGFNSRLDALQAVVLSAKLSRLAQWNAKRRAAAARYDEMLADLHQVTRPRTMLGNEHIWHLYVVQVAGRDAVLDKLHEQGIGAGVHYPIPVHLQGAYAGLGLREGAFPVAEAAAKRILSLPMYGEITAAQQAQVVDALRKALA